MARILIFGEHGQVAKALVRAYAPTDHVIASLGRSSVDIADARAVRSAVAEFHPDLVVNAAAYTAVDKAEDEAEQAFAVNRDGARHVAAAARDAGAPVIHISTDYVFDGTKQTPYLETDETNPIGTYGQSKRDGELAIVCSPDGTNFIKTMLRLAAQREELGVVDDQWGAPTFAADLAAAILTIGERLMRSEDRSDICGIYNATGSGETTWCGLARAIMQLSARRGGPACRVRAIQTSEYPTRARRPANSRLNCAKLQRVFGIRLPPWEDSLAQCLHELIPNPEATTS
jgi:dTDP-4-dehydrorhamnose reductase